MKRRHATTALASAALAAVLALVGCNRSGGESAAADSTRAAAATGGASMASDAENVGQKPGAAAKKKRKKRERPVSVSVSEAFRGDLVEPVIAEGSLRARHEAEIRAEISGRVVAVAASEGSRLRRGQLIARLDDREYAAALEEARARYLQALSLLAIEEQDVEVADLARSVRDEFANLEAQERRGEITRAERIAREVDADVRALREGKFRFEVAAARSGVSEARAALERARVNLERTEIRAPFAGTLADFTLSRGEQVSAGQVLGVLVDDVHLEAQVGVLEADLAYVEEGRDALVEVPSLDRILPAKVDVVNPRFDRDSRTCRVLMRVDNRDRKLRPGMFVRAQIAGRVHRDRLLVPREAILERDGRPLLFKVQDGRARWLYVRVGARNDHLVEIQRVLQGETLEPGDLVAVDNNLTLAHDARVKVRKRIPVADPWVRLRQKAAP